MGHFIRENGQVAQLLGLDFVTYFQSVSVSDTVSTSHKLELNKLICLENPHFQSQKIVVSLSAMFGFAIPYFSVLMFFFAKYLALYTSRFGFPKIWPVLLFSFVGFVNFLSFLICLEFGTRYEETSEGCTLSKDMKVVLTIPMILTFALFITLHLTVTFSFVRKLNTSGT